MSRHYLASRQTCFGGQAANLPEILRALARSRPALATQLKAVDTAAVVARVAHDALVDVAQQVRGATLVNHFERPSDFNTGAWQPPSGECVGVLQLSGDRQIGLIRNGDALTLHMVHPQDSGAGDLAAVQQQLERAFCQRIVAAAVSILGGDLIRRETMPDGTVVLTFEDRVGGGGVR